MDNINKFIILGINGNVSKETKRYKKILVWIFLGLIKFIIVCCMKDRTPKVNTTNMVDNGTIEKYENKYETSKKLHCLKEDEVLI